MTLRSKPLLNLSFHINFVKIKFRFIHFHAHPNNFNPNDGHKKCCFNPGAYKNTRDKKISLRPIGNSREVS